MNSERILIIAEAGVNHNGSPEMAARLVDAAAEAGADAVKFQVFKTEKTLSRNSPKAEYQRATTGEFESFLEMARKLELSFAEFERLRTLCAGRGIAFLASPFDDESLRFLLEGPRVPLIKIASGEVTNAPLLLQAARGGLPVILSTGMSDLGEIEAALGVLAFGYTTETSLVACDEGVRPADGPAVRQRPPQAVRPYLQEPALDAFHAAFRSEAGRRALRERVTLLHCTTEYPAPVEDANLRAMDTLRDRFGLPVGLSDHTPGMVVALAAAARGAAVIEKHFTLDRNLPGPDHAASLEPAELKTMIEGMRTVEAALGSGSKKAAPSELKNRPVARRSLVAARPIQKGERFTSENLTAKRPGTGISPMRYWEFLGSAADRKYETDDLIDGAPNPR